jgi:hypothetical protein
MGMKFKGYLKVSDSDIWKAQKKIDDKIVSLSKLSDSYGTTAVRQFMIYLKRKYPNNNDVNDVLKDWTINLNPLIRKEWKKYVNSLLAEEYQFTLGNMYSVYVDPTLKELNSVKFENMVRFIAHMEEEQIFVFHPDLLHYPVYMKLTTDGIVPPGDFWNFNIFGVARVEGKYLKYESSDSLEYHKKLRTILFKKYKGKDDWTKKWFKKSLVDTIQELFQADGHRR